MAEVFLISLRQKGTYYGKRKRYHETRFFFYHRPDALRDFIVTCKEKRKKFQILSIRGRAEPGRYKK